MRKPYRSDLTDEQWELIRELLPMAKPGGRPRTVDLREVVNTLMYQARTGCQWDYLPHDLVAKSTVTLRSHPHRENCVLCRGRLPLPLRSRCLIGL